MKSNYYAVSQTHEDFNWPRLVPLSEKPAQPPIRTGCRLFFPKKDSHVICNQVNYENNKQRLNRLKEIENKDHNIFNSREKIMLLNENLNNKRWKELKSTYQIDFEKNILNYKDLMAQISMLVRPTMCPRKDLTKKIYIDPIAFKKVIDKYPIII